MTSILPSLATSPLLDQKSVMRIGRMHTRPSVWMLGGLLLCAVVLTLPLTLALGAFYWDIYVYYDGAHRVLRGQTPSVDFFAPVGPLSYWLVAAFMRAFPSAQPLLLVNWCLLPISLLAMAAVLLGFERRSPYVAWTLASLFVILQILPLNFEQFTIYSSFDGFGTYNRHTSGLLYVLISGLLFVKNRKLLIFIVTGLCTALFLLKITGFAAALAVCCLAWLGGRLRWNEVWRSSVFFGCVLIALEIWTGVTSAYLRDLIILLQLNSETLLWRWVRAASTHAGALGVYAVLACTIAWIIRYRIRLALALLLQKRRASALFYLANLNLTWLIVTVLMGWFLETQNTGGHAFILSWPVLIKIVSGQDLKYNLIAILVAAAILPPLIDTFGRAAKAGFATAILTRLDDPALKTLGRVSHRLDDGRNAELRQRAYGVSNSTQEIFLQSGGVDNVDQFSSPEFQVLWLRAAAEAVRAVRQVEEQTSMRFGSVLNVGYVNPFPYLLDRDAPRLVAIGADPSRTTPQPDAATLASIAETDLLLVSNCPATTPDYKLAMLYSPVIRSRQPIRISQCWIALPKYPLGKAQQ